MRTWIPFLIVVLVCSVGLATNASSTEVAVAISGDVVFKKRPSDGPVIVYVDGAGPAFNTPLQGSVTQRNRTFAPGALVVSQDAVVDFPNEDNVLHNVFSLTPGSEFDLAEYGAGRTRSWVASEAGEVEVYCNRHEDMAMKLLVLPNIWYADVTDEGTFHIEGVAPGSHTLVAWSASHWEQRVQVEVPASGVVEAHFTLKRRPTDVPHTDKFGMPYYR